MPCYAKGPPPLGKGPELRKLVAGAGLNPRLLGYEQAARRPSTFSLSLDIALDLSRSRGEVSTSLTCAVPSHAVLVTAMVRTPSAITPGKALRLACLTRVHQSHAGATCLAGAHAYPPPGRLAGRGGALKNCSVASAIQLQ
jgi:hypothetical protein